jgi:sugar phosphate isomerase/epimerase
MLKSSPEKQLRQYRLGTTSYIYPAPVLPNVRKLAGRVRDIELVFFEYNDASNLPTPEDVNQMKQLAENENLTFTVHLPLDMSIGDWDISLRNKSIDKTKSIIELTRPLNPWGYILHPDRWTPTAKPLVTEPSTLCVENVNLLFDYLLFSLLDSPFGICLDIGHLLQFDLEVMPYLRRCFKKLRIIHLHGVKDGKDHQGLNREMIPLLKEFFNYLEQNNYCGVVTLEVFSEKDLLQSFDTLKEL